MRSISISNQHEQLRIDRAQVKSLFRYLDEVLGDYLLPPGELSIAFLTTPEICRLHEDFLADPTPTDVITFPGDIEEDLAGEICVSPDYAVESAKQHDVTFSYELTLYLVHGWLHLCGLDDKREADRAEMRKAEKRVLHVLETGGKMPTFRF